MRLLKKRRTILINLAGALLLVCAAVLVVLLFFVNSPELMRLFDAVQNVLRGAEDAVRKFILDLNNVWLIVGALLLIYLLKSVIPLLPLSLLCFISAAALPVYVALPVNVLGVVIWVSCNYLWGKLRGTGRVKYYIGKVTTLNNLLERDGKGNPWLLFLMRLTPNFPANTVSRIYGGLGFDYTDYCLITLFGFLPKLVGYIFVGANAFEPFSNSFIVPLIIVFTLSGVSVITVNTIFYRTDKRRRENPPRPAPDTAAVMRDTYS
jgi:uncharacterized membrane protein YdjX (TVP38/TMEM64 family)